MEPAEANMTLRHAESRSVVSLSSTGSPLSRRQWLAQIGTGFGSLGLAAVLADAGLLGDSAQAASSAAAASPLAPKSPHYAPRAKHVIFLFMNGGPSHVDTFDPKPALDKYAGQQPDELTKSNQRNVGKLFPSPYKFAKYGTNGIDVSELYPHTAKVIDEICVIRSMYTDIPNHEPALLMMNSGNTQPTRPCLGSWLTYGLGTENQNLPGYVVLCPGKPTVGPPHQQRQDRPTIGHRARPQQLSAARRPAPAARPAAAAQPRAPRRARRRRAARSSH
jgi:hypothetical protein